MPEPTRPSNLPSDAVWVEERSEFRVSPLVDGLPQGEVRWFRPDGTLACVSTYVAGKGHGPYERFHQNGEWSQRGQMRTGNRHGVCCWRRSVAETTEGTLPPATPERVREARILYVDGLPGPTRFYDGDGVELRSNGEPLPERPAAVDARAGLNEDGTWFFGMGAQDPATREGTWHWWYPEGHVMQTHEYRAGRCVAEFRNHPDGSPELRKYKDARGWDLVQRCFDAAGNEVDTRGTAIPPRPEGVPEDAVFDSMNTRWVSGFDPSTLPPMGTIVIHELDGTKDQVLEFAGGHLRARRRFNRDGSLLAEEAHDAQGREILEILYSARDGSVRHRIARSFDGDELASVEIDVGARRMRGQRAESGIAYEFFGDDGALEARGCVSGKKAVGIWEFVDGGRTHTLDLSGRGLRAKVDEDFEPSWLLGSALLDEGRDDGASFPAVEALAGVDDLDWSEIPSCYGEDVENFPRYLRALVADVAAVRRSALARIYGETLHQGTIYVATAKVLPFLLRLLDHPDADVAELLGYVEAVTSQAQEYREQALAWDEDSDDRIAVLGTLDALEHGFARVAALVDSPDPDIVATALALASRAGEQGESLLLRAASHANWLTAATAVHGLLDRRGDQLTAEAALPWLEHGDPIVRLCAALATARRLGTAAPARTTAVLCEALDHESDLAARFARLPFVKGRLLAYLALGLAQVRDAAAMTRAVGLADRLADLDLFTLDSVSFGLLRLCFGDGQPPFAPGFVDVLAAIASCGRLEGFANFSESSSRFGLPSRASEYRALVETLRTDADPTASMAAVLRMHEDDDDEDDDGDDSPPSS